MLIKDYLISQGVSNVHEAYAYFEKVQDACNIKSSKESYKRRCRKIFKEGLVKDRAKTNTPQINKTSNTNGNIDAVITSSFEIRTIEQLAKYCEININDYQLPPKVVTNVWGGEKSPMHQVKVWWVPKYKTGELTPQDAVNEYKELLKTAKPAKIKDVDFKDRTGNTVFIGLSDSHLGQLSYGREVGSPKEGNYDLKIGSDELLKAINYFTCYYKDKHVKKFILMVGSDLLNVNGTDANITTSGTAQDEDCRAKRTFGVVLDTMIKIINGLSQISKVDTVFCPGNHDNTVSWFMNTAIAMYYKDSKNVNIDITMQDRKYIKIGETLLGVCHGKTIGKPIKLTGLPGVMADEARELWSSCKYKEYIVGHYHKLHTMEDDYQGTIVRVLPSITKLSYWSYASGYKSIRAMNCYEYDDKKGMVATVVYKP